MTAVGDTVWVFNANHRVYPPRLPGNQFSQCGPIWREHWQPRKIVGETSRSWLVEWNLKVPKKGPVRGVLFSEAEIDELAYVNDHAYRIGEVVGRSVKDAALLRKIAALIGYEARK